MKKKIALFILICLGLTLSACGAKHLSGEYTTTISSFFGETKNTLTFDGDKVTEKQDGKLTNEGTYEISDNNLEITLGKNHMTAKLSEDKKSFTITSTDVLGGIGKGLEYTKK